MGASLVYLDRPNTTKDTATGQSNKLGYRYAMTSMQGWRLSMEDAHIANDNIDGNNTGLFAVFDGHGGKECAEFVQKHFVEVLKQNSNFENKDYQTALKETFKRMDELMLEEDGVTKKSDSRFYSQGCTANVVLITPKHIICANAGDSRSVLARSQNGKDYKSWTLSEDHKPESDWEKARIIASGNKVKEGRVNGTLALSRGFGDFKYKTNESLPHDEQAVTCEPDVQVMIRQQHKDKFIVIACDGIWDCLSDDECIAKMHEKMSQKEVSEAGQLSECIGEIFDEICPEDLATRTKKVGTDNMTALCVELI